MGNLIKRVLGKEDFVAVLEKLSKEIHDADHRLRQYRIQWRKLVSRLTYLFLALEILYGLFWYFLVPADLLPRESFILAAILLVIPLLWYLMTMGIGSYYKFRISSTEALIEELSEKQETKLEQFKENGSYKDVSRILGVIDTPSRGPTSPRGRGGIPPSSVKRNAAGGDKHVGPSVPGSAKRPESAKPITSSKTEATKDEKNTENTSEANTQAQMTRSASETNVAAQQQAGNPSQSQTQQRRWSMHPDTPIASSSGRSSASSGSQRLPDTPMAPTPARLHLNPVPQSPYKPYMPRPDSAPAPEAPRGWMDSMLDFLIGTSATVPKLCQFCGAHNGLVPIEEQGNVEFVCVRCRAFNSPRMQASSSSSSKELLANALRSKMSPEDIAAAKASLASSSASVTSESTPSPPVDQQEAAPSAPSPAEPEPFEKKEKKD